MEYEKKKRRLMTSDKFGKIVSIYLNKNYNNYKAKRESESGSVMSDSLQLHIQSMEFSRPEYWSG